MKSKTRNQFHVGASVFLLVGSLVAVAWAPHVDAQEQAAQGAAPVAGGIEEIVNAAVVQDGCRRRAARADPE